MQVSVVLCLYHAMHVILTDLDKTALEQHLNHLLENGQNATVVNSKTSLQHVLHVKHLLRRQKEKRQGERQSARDL